MSQLCINSRAEARQVSGANKGTADTTLPCPERLLFLQGVNIACAPPIPHFPPSQGAGWVSLSPPAPDECGFPQGGTAGSIPGSGVVWGGVRSSVPKRTLGQGSSPNAQPPACPIRPPARGRRVHPAEAAGTLSCGAGKAAAHTCRPEQTPSSLPPVSDKLANPSP